MNLSSVQREVLQALIDDMRTHGCTPPVSRLRELTQKGSYLPVTLNALIDAGYVAHPHTGRYVPIRDVDGHSIKIQVLREGKSTQPSEDHEGRLQKLESKFGILDDFLALMGKISSLNGGQ